MFAVSPKLDCPHVKFLNKSNVLNYFILKSNLESCHICHDDQENWLCLDCLGTYCSRYINGHMSQHNENYKEHSLAISYSDGSIWCYSCDSYIDCIDVVPIRRALSNVKFPEDNNIKNNALTSIKEEDDNDNDDIENDLNDQGASSFEEHVINERNIEIDNITLEGGNIKDKEQLVNNIELNDSSSTTTSMQFSYEELVKGMNSNIYKRIVFLTGAGISVAAGIPDFRTPGTGLYSKLLEEYNLPYPPETIFHIDYLQSNPLAFYKVANRLLSYKAKPVYAHKFIKKCHDNDLLLMNYTQNIDGLELEAGLPLSHLIQAHGHMRSAHCYKCRSKASIDLFIEHVQKEEVLYCTDCVLYPDNCNSTAGIIKPEIIFFGENLPQIFFENMDLMKSADLVFVMGTSLKVFPFTLLISLISTSTPIVVINKELPASLHTISSNNSINSNNSSTTNNSQKQQQHNKLLFISGDIEENIIKLAKDINWDL